MHENLDTIIKDTLKHASRLGRNGGRYHTAVSYLQAQLGHYRTHLSAAVPNSRAIIEKTRQRLIPEEQEYETWWQENGYRYSIRNTADVTHHAQYSNTEMVFDFFSYVLLAAEAMISYQMLLDGIRTLRTPTPGDFLSAILVGGVIFIGSAAIKRSLGHLPRSFKGLTLLGLLATTAGALYFLAQNRILGESSDQRSLLMSNLCFVGVFFFAALAMSYTIRDPYKKREAADIFPVMQGLLQTRAQLKEQEEDHSFYQSELAKVSELSTSALEDKVVGAFISGARSMRLFRNSDAPLIEAEDFLARRQRASNARNDRSLIEVVRHEK